MCARREEARRAMRWANGFRTEPGSRGDRTPRRRPGFAASLSLLVALLLVVALSLGPLTPVGRATDAGFPLEGEWYVLVHYTDSASDEPTLVRWRDAVWRFDRNGKRLTWLDHGTVGFDNESGRYETLSTGERARIQYAWQPSPDQLKNIRAGLHVGKQNARSKTLRGDDDQGWSTRGEARAGSASTIGYSERWKITGLAEQPVFEQSALMGSARTESLEGTTRYETERKSAEAGILAGRYERDGEQSGQFWMWRAGSEGELPAAAAQLVTDDERARTATASVAPSLLGPGGLARLPVLDLQSRLDAEHDSMEARAAIRAAIVALVEESYTRRGLSLHRERAEIDRLVLEVERLAVVEGVSLEEIERRYAAGELVP